MKRSVRMRERSRRTPKDLIEFLTFGREARTHDVGGDGEAHQFYENLFHSLAQNDDFTLNVEHRKITLRTRPFLYLQVAW